MLLMGFSMPIVALTTPTVAFMEPLLVPFIMNSALGEAATVALTNIALASLAQVALNLNINNLNLLNKPALAEVDKNLLL